MNDEIEELEIVDSTAMQVLTSFDVELNDENNLRCFIKSDDYWIVFAIGSEKNSTGYLAFAKENVELVNKNLQEVLAGKLFDEELDAITFENAKDEFQISASSVFPSNRAVPRETITIMNLREMELDGLDITTGLCVSNKSAEKLHSELEKLLN
jgi:hypothetical protein